MVAVSLFKKQIANPIQATKGNPLLEIPHKGQNLTWATGTDTFVNSDSATVEGIELECKLGLNSFNDILSNFRIGGNLTWSQSEVALSQFEIDSFPGIGVSPNYENLNVANRMKRALEGQSEWIYTFDLSYTNEDWGVTSTLVYSFYDTRLNAASYDHPDDFWEDAFSTFDSITSYSLGQDDMWTIKLAMKNLIPEDRIIRIRDSKYIYRRYSTPSTFSLSLSKDF